MSSRNFRKMTQARITLPPPDDDDDYEPMYTRSPKSDFNLLGVESQSSEKDNDTESADEVSRVSARAKKNKKKKKKLNKTRQKKGSISENIKDLDEIDRSLLEIDAMLGPAPPAPMVEPPPPVDPKTVIMSVKPKYLNAAEEMNRLFGPDEEELRLRRGRHNQNQWLRRSIILPPIEKGRAIHFVNGLTMTLVRREDDVMYFVYNHNKELQKVHRALLVTRAGRWGSTNVMPQSLDDPTHAHMEGLIDTMDILFALEQYSVARVLVEQALTHVQRVADNFFNITNPNVRLEYKYRENRAFHILVLKYLYLVTNRACHRTALEMAKVLMNLDPSDPLAVVLIIDTLALRAREHKWLINAVDLWSKERNAECLFNIQYSHALAHFHVNRNRKEADRLLQIAIFGYPKMVLKLYECCSVNDPKISSHPMFKDNDITSNLGDLMTLYAKLTWSRWKEPKVMEWFKENVNDVANKYLTSSSIRESAKKFKNKRMNLFQIWPNEIIRHLSIIKPMAHLLVDGAVPEIGRNCPFNPVPPHDGIDRYNYDGPSDNGIPDPSHNIFYNLLSSIRPTHNPYLDRENDGEAEEAGAVGPALAPEQRFVVRNQPPAYEFNPALNINYQRLLKIRRNYHPRNNDLYNVTSEMREAFISFLDELLEIIIVIEVEYQLKIMQQKSVVAERKVSTAGKNTIIQRGFWLEAEIAGGPSSGLRVLATARDKTRKSGKSKPKKRSRPVAVKETFEKQLPWSMKIGIKTKDKKETKEENKTEQIETEENAAVQETEEYKERVKTGAIKKIFKKKKEDKKDGTNED